MSGLRGTRRRGEPPPRSAVVFLTAIEAQAVANSETTALRALLLPDYDGVAVAFAGLLVKVIQRCKRDDQVDGRVLHACEALGVYEGRPVSVEVLARRLRGFGLAWHGFTTEECQAFICDELDMDQDGQVRVQDVFAFLRSLWAQQDRRARPHQSLTLGGGRSCGEGHRRRGTRRQQTAVEAGMFATRKFPRGLQQFPRGLQQFPRGLQQKLRAAAGRARLCGVDVLKALQGAASPSSRCRRCTGDMKDSSPLGVEATARFLRSIGVGFDSHHPSISANRGFGERLSHPRCEVEAPGEADLSESRDVRASVRPREPFPSEDELVVHVPSSSTQRGRWGSDDRQNRCQAGEATRAEPSWAQGDVFQAFHDQCEDRVAEAPNGRARGRDGVRTTRSRPPDPTARVQRCWSNPSASPKVPSRFDRVTHGGGASGCCDEDAGSGGECAVGAADCVGDEETREDFGTCNSQRLRRAADDLKRMQSEYLALQRQVRGEPRDNPSTPSPPPPPPPPPPTTTEVANLDDYIVDHCLDDTAAAAAAAAGRRSSHNTLLRPASFLPGHTNPQNNGAHHYYFSRAKQQQQQQQQQQKQQQPWSGFQEADGDSHRGWGTDDGSADGGGGDGDDGNGRRFRDHRKEERLFLRPPPLVMRPKSSSSSSNAFDNSRTAAVRYQHHTAHADSSEGARQNGWVTGWPRCAPDTRKCRALLLMAAQGKACREDTFDVATARNGFSGIRSQQALGLSEEKGCSTPKPRDRRCDARARNRGDDRGRAGHRGGMHAVSASVATDENGSSSEPRCMRGVHAFLSPGEAATRRTAGPTVLPEEDERTRDWRDRTPERRPARPRAIKSPMYAKRGRSEERNVWDKRTGRWARSTSKGRSAARVRGRSVDNPCNVRTTSRDVRCF
ncbi:unnamed protein product [Ectocarpus fasciculatus]